MVKLKAWIKCRKCKSEYCIDDGYCCPVCGKANVPDEYNEIN